MLEEQEEAFPDPKKPTVQKIELSRMGGLSKGKPAILARKQSPDQTRQGHLLRITKLVSVARKFVK